MDRLSIHSRYADEQNEIIVIEFDGSLDLSTFDQFESILKAYLEKGQPKFICNFSRLKRISSYAFGYFAGLLDYIRLHQGDITLVNVPVKYKTIIEKIRRPESQLKMFDNDSDAIEHFLYHKHQQGHYQFNVIASQEKVVSGLPFKLKIEVLDPFGNKVNNYNGMPHVIVDRGMVHPALIRDFKSGVWEGDMIVTEPGDVKIRVWDDQGVGTEEVHTTEEGEAVDFPINVHCPGCKMTNVAGKTDVLRCIHCNEIYFVDKFGHIIPLKPGNTSGTGIVKRLDFNMPSDVNYLNHVRNFIVGISAEEKIDDEKIAQIEMSLDEALANVIEHAYSYDAYQEIQISVALYTDKLEIILRDHGRSFDNDNTPLPDLKKHIEERRVGGLGRYLMKTLMDEVDYKTDGQTNQLRMMKKF